jgi:hypothetical protein
MNIVIVESPAKAKTINKYLGPSYEVLASFGHVRDLPAKNGSVDPDANFQAFAGVAILVNDGVGSMALGTSSALAILKEIKAFRSEYAAFPALSCYNAVPSGAFHCIGQLAEWASLGLSLFKGTANNRVSPANKSLSGRNTFWQGEHSCCVHYLGSA